MRVNTTVLGYNLYFQRVPLAALIRIDLGRQERQTEDNYYS